MSDTLQFHSQVGDDGFLILQVDLGRTEAKKDVLITVRTLEDEKTVASYNNLPWHEFVEKTYGSCADCGLERPSQGEFEMREPIS